MKVGDKVVVSLHTGGNTRYDRKPATFLRYSAPGYVILKSDVDGEEIMIKEAECHIQQKWMKQTGHPPDFCDLCGEHFVLGWPDEADTCYDGRTRQGPWAWMCRVCFIEMGVGLGTGKGQKYVYNEEDNKWYKEAG